MTEIAKKKNIGNCCFCFDISVISTKNMVYKTKVYNITSSCSVTAFNFGIRECWNPYISVSEFSPKNLSLLFLSCFSLLQLLQSY